MRVGFTVSKKVGNSRRAQSRAAAAARDGAARAAGPMRPGHDYVLIGRRAALDLPFDRLVEDFDARAGRVHAAARDRRKAGRRRPPPHMRAQDRAPDMTDQKNTILAIVLSALVLIAWQYFVGLPQMEKQKQEAQLKAQQQQQQQTQHRPAARPGRPPAQPGEPPRRRSRPGAAPTPRSSCRARRCSKASPRVAIETPRLSGSIALKGAQIDDLALTQYHETVDPNSPPIVLLSPAGSPHPFYAEFGWVGGAGVDGEGARQQHGVDPARLGRARRRQAGHADLGQRRRAANSAASSRSTTSICSPSKTRSTTRARAPVDALSVRADLAATARRRRSATTSCTKA